MAVKKGVKKKVAKTKEKDNRKVPFKNYLILLFVCLLTVCLFAGGSVMYRKVQKMRLEVSPLKQLVPEISVDDLDSYVVENDLFYLYVGASGDYQCHVLEEDILKYIKDKDIKNDIVMLNVKNISNYSKFRKDFNDKFSQFDYAKLENYPAFIIFKDGKVLNLVQKNKEFKLDVGHIDGLLEEYGLQK